MEIRTNRTSGENINQEHHFMMEENTKACASLMTGINFASKNKSDMGGALKGERILSRVAPNSDANKMYRKCEMLSNHI